MAATCVLSSIDAELTIDFGVRGCFGGSDNRVSISHRDGGFLLEGFLFEDLDTRRRIARQPVSPELATRFLNDIAGAMQIVEVAGTCRSTNQSFAHVEMRCGSQTKSMTFQSNACGPRWTRDSVDEPKTVQRAFAISEVAERGLRSVKRETVPLTPLEEAEQ